VHHVICQILSKKEEEELKVTNAFQVFSRKYKTLPNSWRMNKSSIVNLTVFWMFVSLWYTNFISFSQCLFDCLYCWLKNNPEELSVWSSVLLTQRVKSLNSTSVPTASKHTSWVQITSLSRSVYYFCSRKLQNKNSHKSEKHNFSTPGWFELILQVIYYFEELSSYMYLLLVTPFSSHRWKTLAQVWNNAVYIIKCVSSCNKVPTTVHNCKNNRPNGHGLESSTTRKVKGQRHLPPPVSPSSSLRRRGSLCQGRKF